MPITKEQAAHLNQRISNHFTENRYRKRDEKPVAKAEALVQAWEKKQQDAANEHIRKLSSARTVAQEAVLSGDWAAALTAVKKFETAKT